jgi:hypothetical protein
MNPNDRSAIRTFSRKDKSIVASFAGYRRWGSAVQTAHQMKIVMRDRAAQVRKRFALHQFIQPSMMNCVVSMSFGSSHTVMLP